MQRTQLLLKFDIFKRDQAAKTRKAQKTCPIANDIAKLSRKMVGENC